MCSVQGKEDEATGSAGRLAFVGSGRLCRPKGGSALSGELRSWFGHYANES